MHTALVLGKQLVGDPSTIRRSTTKVGTGVRHRQAMCAATQQRVSKKRLGRLKVGPGNGNDRISKARVFKSNAGKPS